MSGSDAKHCDAILALTTVDSAEQGKAMAEALVNAGLAACVSLLPGITSVYRWKGAIQSESETLLLIKTTRAVVDDLTAWIDSNHPYETPEFLCFEPTAGGGSYLGWLVEATRQRGSGSE